MRPLTLRTAYRNIRAVFDKATPADVAEGCNWYSEARENCARMSELYGIPKDAAAWIIAALSPNAKWERNLRDAWALTGALEAGHSPATVPCQTYGQNKDKAVRIWQLAKAGLPYAGIAGGRKVTAFARNIASGGEGEDVTVDFHAYGIARGRKFTAATAKFGAPEYRLIASAYRKVAQDVGIAAPQLQAVTWLVWRRL